MSLRDNQLSSHTWSIAEEEDWTRRAADMLFDIILLLSQVILMILYLVSQVSDDEEE